jgi:segregation and condensation protein A
MMREHSRLEPLMADRAIDPTLANYQLRLPAYEGPLDVLLRLIERSQLAIADVSLVTVTDQFLQFAAGMEAAPPTVIAEFAAVGARLTVLKSRSLLPRPVAETEEPEQSDLTHQLREYKQIKDLARHLGNLHQRGMQAHGAMSGAVARPQQSRVVRLLPHEAPSLARALRRRISTMTKPQTLIAQRRVISLRDLVSRLADMVLPYRRLPFSQYTADLRTRTEVATAFLAVLVLVRRGQVEAAQTDLFGEIGLHKGGVGADEANSIEEFVN